MESKSAAPRLARDKVFDLAGLAEWVRIAREGRIRVAHCHGCFDILHMGHVRHFEAARRLADALVVTVTPDRFVNKGPNRPVWPEAQRAEVVGALACVDAVAVNAWPTAVETIRLLRTDLFVKGQEYAVAPAQDHPGFIAEKAAAASAGVTVAFTREHVESSSAAVRKMQEATR